MAWMTHNTNAVKVFVHRVGVPYKPKRQGNVIGSLETVKPIPIISQPAK
jgi:transposase